MRPLKTARRPPIYPKTPGHLPCSSLTHPLPLPSRRPSVSFGGFGLTTNGYVESIQLAADGKVFFALNDHASGQPDRLGQLDPVTNQITTWSLDFEVSTHIQGLQLDSTGKLWVLGSDRVVRLDPGTNNLTTWNLQGVATNIRHLSVDTQQRPVFSGQVSQTSPYYGIGRIDPVSGLFTKWPDSIFLSTIWYVSADSSGAIWLQQGSSASSYEIMRFDP